MIFVRNNQNSLQIVFICMIYIMCPTCWTPKNILLHNTFEEYSTPHIFGYLKSLKHNGKVNETLDKSIFVSDITMQQIYEFIDEHFPTLFYPTYPAAFEKIIYSHDYNTNLSHLVRASLYQFQLYQNVYQNCQNHVIDRLLILPQILEQELIFLDEKNARRNRLLL